MTEHCPRRTLNGGHGVDDASQVREYGCGKEPGHDGVCDYTRLLGLPSTAVGVSAEVPVRWSTKSRMARVEALSERVSSREVQTPIRVYVRLMDQVKVARDVLVAFGPIDEVDGLLDRTEAEVLRWE